MNNFAQGIQSLPPLPVPPWMPIPMPLEDCLVHEDLLLNWGRKLESHSLTTVLTSCIIPLATSSRSRGAALKLGMTTLTYYEN